MIWCVSSQCVFLCSPFPSCECIYTQNTLVCYVLKLNTHYHEYFPVSWKHNFLWLHGISLYVSIWNLLNQPAAGVYYFHFGALNLWHCDELFFHTNILVIALMLLEVELLSQRLWVPNSLNWIFISAHLPIWLKKKLSHFNLYLINRVNERFMDCEFICLLCFIDVFKCFMCIIQNFPQLGDQSILFQNTCSGRIYILQYNIECSQPLAWYISKSCVSLGNNFLVSFRCFIVLDLPPPPLPIWEFLG